MLDKSFGCAIDKGETDEAGISPLQIGEVYIVSDIVQVYAPVSHFGKIQRHPSLP